MTLVDQVDPGPDDLHHSNEKEEYMCETNTILMRRGGGYMCETNTILISISMRCSSASRAYTAADTAADNAASQASLNLFSEKPGVSHRKPSTIGPAV